MKGLLLLPFLFSLIPTANAGVYYYPERNESGIKVICDDTLSLHRLRFNDGTEYALKGDGKRKYRNPKFPKESTGWVADAPGGGCRTVVTGSDRGGVRSGDGQVDGDVNIVVCPRSPYCGNEARGKFKIMWWWDNNTMQDSSVIDTST